MLAACALTALPASAADHIDSPLTKTDGRTDITDIYAFQSPENADNTVLILNVNPIAGTLSGTTFDPRGSYVLNVDNNGDARSDVEVEVSFGNPDGNGQQKVKVKVDRATVGMGTTGETIQLRRGGKAWAGLADDPFFFDLQAFRDLKTMLGGGGPGMGRTFCDANATDFFQGTNVSSIVVEVPSAALTAKGNPNIGVWATTFSGRTLKDQMGRPAINTVFVGDDRKDEFNATTPDRMRDAFGELFVDDLVMLSGLDGSGYTQQQAQTIADVLLPDILTVDTSSNAGFLNGRQPSNDVIDAELALVTGGADGGTPVLSSDCIGANDVALPNTFPYLAPKH
jgi:hypothetical protein